MAIPFPDRKARTSAIHPNAGIRAAYQRKLQRLVDEMANSVQYWLRAAYRADEPVMAQDAVPAKELQAAVNEMAKRWRGRFDKAAPEMARWFATKASRRSDAALRAILKRGGFTVEFKMNAAMRDVFASTVEANVGLIKSIPEQYLGQVQGAVMRSVQTGRDLAGLTKELQRHFGVTRRRAEFIARDQNNKATSALMKARQVDMGIEKGIWLHSHSGKEPRPTHVKKSGKEFSIVDGWYDPDPKVRRHIMPGELINCHCVWKPKIPGFS